MARIKHLTEEEYIEALLKAWEARPQSMHNPPGQKWHPEDLYYNLDSFIAGVTAALASQHEESDSPPPLDPQNLRLERDPLIPGLFWLWAEDKGIQIQADNINLDHDKKMIYLDLDPRDRSEVTVALHAWLQRHGRTAWLQAPWEELPK